MPSMPFKKKDPSASSYRLATDRDLISACLTGDEVAWDALIDRYAALVFSVCVRMGMPQSDAEDIFQDVCLILFEHLEDIRDTARLSGWLISTTRREVWRASRKRNVTLASELGEAEWEMEGAESVHPQKATGNPEGAILALAEQQLMREAVERLPERCRMLLLQLYATDDPLSYQELAEKFSLPVGSIGPTRARCLQNLRKILQGLGY
ncbi:MAG: polymerase, sigma-24 subunit, subfamily [Chthonomonadaceae bacterium]|nr:polymerase, sigma-24 subunit, subfamily [Chthonomonadaceae bacterium]